MTILDTTIHHITITPGVAGGKPHIIGRRITVAEIVIWHLHQDLTIDQIVEEYGLTHADVYAALTYYYDNQTIIDAAIQADAIFADLMRQQIASKISS